MCNPCGIISLQKIFFFFPLAGPYKTMEYTIHTPNASLIPNISWSKFGTCKEKITDQETINRDKWIDQID